MSIIVVIVDIPLLHNAEKKKKKNAYTKYGNRERGGSVVYIQKDFNAYLEI